MARSYTSRERGLPRATTPEEFRARQIGGRAAGRRGGWTDLVELYRSLPPDSAETFGNPSLRRRPFVDPRPTLRLFIREPSPLVEGKTCCRPLRGGLLSPSRAGFANGWKRAMSVEEATVTTDCSGLERETAL